MHFLEFARNILMSGKLEDKLFTPEQVSFDSSFLKNEDFIKDLSLIKSPAREKEISFKQSKKKFRFPKKDGLRQIDKKMYAFNSFANHELLAIEIMALALLKFDYKTTEDIKIAKQVVSTIKDEQKHFLLYQKSLKNNQYDFGCFPLNDFFWKYLSKMKSIKNFFSCMSLTFEAANLDFAHYYYECFKEIGDNQSAQIMKIVFDDEIRHVQFGIWGLNQWRKDKTLWDYYVENLIEPLTPERSVGILYKREHRISSGLSDDFIHELEKHMINPSQFKRKSYNVVSN